MRQSPVLLKQHIGWHFAKHWFVQGKKKPIYTGAEKVLRQKGITIFQPEDIIGEKKVLEKVEILGYKDKEVKFDETHPDWHDEVLLSYKDSHVLLEGLTQAKVLTNTVEVKSGLPDENNALKDLPKVVNNFAKNIIMTSHVFDAEQKMLPKIKDPERPAWNFPRIYGITQDRKNKLIIAKLLQMIESNSDYQLVRDRYLFNELLFSFPFEYNGKLVQFQLSGETLLSSTKPLSKITTESTGNIPLTDLYPLYPTVSLKQENIYKLENIFPIKSIKKYHPHTLFIHYNKEVVKNETEEEVTNTQIEGRSLLKAFTVAASYARKKYGEDIQSLPEPFTLQVVQTDSRFFHFGILQLNTLHLEDPQVRNIWYQSPIQYLFENCSYKLGRPILEGYNSDVIKQLFTFYNKV